MATCHYLLKMVATGDSGVGKTALLTRFADDSFVDGWLSTIGVDFRIKYIEIMDYVDANDPHVATTPPPATKNKLARLELWDTAGQERFKSIVRQYYRGAYGVMLVYDTTDEASLENAVNVWLPEIRQHAISTLKVPILLVGTKADLKAARKVKLERAQQLARDNNLLPPVETSSKESSNVELAFRILAHQILKERHSSFLQPKEEPKVQLLMGSSSINGVNTKASGYCSC